MTWLFVLVFTVVAGSTSIYSFIESKFITSTEAVEINANTSPPISLASIIDKWHSINFEIASDVALITIFDPLTLKHRFRDNENWWIGDQELVKEMNRGNGIFINTGADGFYKINIHGGEPKIPGHEVKAKLVCDGGLFYVGGNPLDGLNNITTPFGDYFSCDKGIYQVTIRANSNYAVDLTFNRIDKFTRNSLTSLPHLDELM